MTSNTSISDRAQYLLKTLIECYVLDGKPIGSRHLAKDRLLNLSPATIRNVMADLEEMGLIASPHTSAGRIPTVKGYRLFVDSLLTVKPLRSKEARKIEEELVKNPSDTHGLIETASDLLSGITQMAGVVMIPRLDHNTFQQVDFLQLSGNQVLAVIVINNCEVQNRVIQTNRHYSPAELQQAANYLTSAFAGQDIEGVRSRLLNEMQATRDSMNKMMQTVIDMAEQVFDGQTSEQDYVMAGETNLMNFAELSNVGRLRDLFEIFNQKRDILHLLDMCLKGQGVQIFIGDESGHKALDDISVVTSPYEVDGQTVGVLGVIGPTRMAYEKVIPIVDMTARMLSSVLNQR